MNPRKLIFVANWKSELSVQETVQYCRLYCKELDSLAQRTNKTIVLCPTMPSIALVGTFIKNSTLALGAQNCSPFPKGPYTGEVTAAILQEIGCSYCIIGHSERRSLFNESNNMIAQKTMAALDANLTPIVCVGQKNMDSSIDETMRILQRQLGPVKKLLKNYPSGNHAVLIAYEPVGAIGSGKVPDPQYLNELYMQLTQYIAQWKLKNISFKFLYGGSVNEITIIPMMRIATLDGFLIARASLDFQKFKNMISLSS